MDGGWPAPANNNIYKEKTTYNNNNHFSLRRPVSTSQWTHFGEGFFPLWGGKSWPANLLTPVPPIPSLPALFRQDTTYAWRTAFG